MTDTPTTRRPTDVTQHLKGIHFPASKRDLVEQARRNQADGSVLAGVESLPDKEYGSIAEVMQGFGEETRNE